MNEELMTLFKITIANNNDYYVIAKNFNQAAAKLSQLLNRANYGPVSSSKQIKNIVILASEITTNALSNKPQFYDDRLQLIMPNSCD